MSQHPSSISQGKGLFHDRETFNQDLCRFISKRPAGHVLVNIDKNNVQLDDLKKLSFLACTAFQYNVSYYINRVRKGPLGGEVGTSS